MTKDPKDRSKSAWLWLVIPPMFFIVKDFIAIQIMWSHEPGISEEVAHNFALHLLPGTLFFIAAYAPVVNFGFGILIGVLLYLLVRLYRRRAQVYEVESS